MWLWQAWLTRWRKIVQPPPMLSAETDRQQASMLAAVSVALVLAALVVAFMWLMIGGFVLVAPVILGMMGLMGVVYALSRTRYYRTGAYLLIIGFQLGIMLASIVIPDPVFHRLIGLSFTAVTVLLASILLSQLSAMVTALICLLLLIPFALTPAIGRAEAFAFIIFHMVIDVLAIVSIGVRRGFARLSEENARRYHALFEQSNDGVFIISLDGVQLDVNRRAANMLGYTVDEVIGLSVQDIVVPEEYDSSQKVLKRLIANEHVAPYERTFRCKDGSLLSVEVNVELVRDAAGHPLHLQSIVRDISERKQAEARLRESEAYQRAIIQNAPFGAHFYRLETDGRLIFEGANPAADRILNLDHRELAGSTLEAAFPSSVHTELPATYRRIAREGGIFHHDQLNYGDQRVGLSAFEIYAFQTLPQRMAVFFNDISERRLLERQAFDLALEQERVRMLSSFIEGAAHEFRTPLAIINTSLYLMLNARTASAEKHQRHANQIETQVSRLARLLDMLLDTMRLESGIPFNVQPRALREVVARACAAAERKVQAKQIELRLESDPVPDLPCDEEWLRQVFDHLLDNAVRFTPEGGQISLHIYCQDDMAVVDIQDSGAGISEQALPYIFQPFWRQDEAHSTPGFGLGLSIAQKIVQQHQGRIEVTSAPGQGSLFRVLLPLSADIHAAGGAGR